MSGNVCDDKLAVSDSGAVQTDLKTACPACGRRFRPDHAGQKFCDHACYSESLRIPVVQRFWSKLNKTQPPPHCFALGPCWIFTGKARLGRYGHGSIAGVVNGKRRPLYTHRVAWELTNGPIPDGVCVLHRCDVALCCNPDHLFLGSKQDNLADARQKGRLDTTLARTTTQLTPTERLAIFDTREYRGVCIDLAIQYNVTKACISAIRAGRFKRPAQPVTPPVFERVPHVMLEIRGDIHFSNPTVPSLVLLRNSFAEPR